MRFEDIEKARQEYFKKRKEYLCKLSLPIGGAFVVALIILFTSGLLSLDLGFIFRGGMICFFATFVIIGFIAVCVGVGVKTGKFAEMYRKAYKGYFVAQVLDKTFTDLYYSHDEGLNESVLKATEMVNTGDRYSSNDYTRGKYKDVDFEQADVHIQEEHTDSDGDTTYVTIFRGRFMIFEFPKKFQSRLLVAGKRAGAMRVPWRGKFKKYETESNEFNKTFKVYTEDGFEMFYLLDPAMMERMEKIADTYKDTVGFGFYDNKLLIGINDGKDSFEPPHINKPLDEEVELKKNMADAKVITDFVDNLRLDK